MGGSRDSFVFDKVSDEAFYVTITVAGHSLLDAAGTCLWSRKTRGVLWPLMN